MRNFKNNNKNVLIRKKMRYRLLPFFTFNELLYIIDMIKYT